MRHVAQFLRRYPWIVSNSYHLWRFFQPKYTLGAVGVVLNTENQILLAEHAFHPKLPWGLPGGWVGPREDPQIAIQREFQEELSLQVEVGPLLLTDRPFPNHLDMAFLCRATGPVGTLSYEVLSYRWFDFEALPRIRKFNYRAIQQALSFAQLTEFNTWLLLD